MVAGSFAYFIVSTKPSPGLEGGPFVRMLQSDVPCARAAHRESSQHDSVRIDVVALADRFERFEDVRLTGPPISIIDASEYFDHDLLLIGGERLRRIVTE